MNSGLLLTTILALVAIQTTSADTDFEEFLSSLYFEAPEYLSRVARHADKGKFKICCGKRETLMTEEEIEASKSCKEKDSDSGEKKEKFTCMLDCIGKKIGVVDSDGNVIPAKLIEKIKSKFDETELKDKVESIAPAIIDNANANKGNGKCSKALMMSSFKIIGEIEKTCPENLKNNSDNCKKKREWMEKKRKEHQQ